MAKYTESHGIQLRFVGPAGLLAAPTTKSGRGNDSVIDEFKNKGPEK